MVPFRKLVVEPLRDVAQEVVSFVVAVGGVDPLEPVDVGDEERKRFLVVDPTGYGRLERACVWQAGQHVTISEHLQLVR
jgi:hypothetical protein